MNIEWRGPTDITLHLLDRHKILDQFKWIVSNGGEHKNTDIIVLDRFGTHKSIVKVADTDKGVFIYPMDTEDQYYKSLLKMAPIMGSNMHKMTFEEVNTVLEKCKNNNVYLQFPNSDPHTVVGKIFSINDKSTMTVIMIPVPKDIETINERIMADCVKLGCEVAAKGIQCGACPKLSTCEILKKVEEETLKQNGET